MHCIHFVRFVRFSQQREFYPLNYIKRLAFTIGKNFVLCEAGTEV
jgi:hypothetical protein